jgi:hypothetical protein
MINENCKTKSITMVKNLKSYLLLEALVKTENGIERKLFVEGYWLEKVKFKGEKKERYLLMDEKSEVRCWYDNLMKDYEVEERWVRFFDVNEVKKKEKERLVREEIKELEKGKSKEEKNELKKKRDKLKEMKKRLEMSKEKEMGNEVLFLGLKKKNKCKGFGMAKVFEDVDARIGDYILVA